jgi:hypothetical protein
MNARRSFDHLVGAGEQRCRHVEAGRLGGLHVDSQVELRARRREGWRLPGIRMNQNRFDLHAEATRALAKLGSELLRAYKREVAAGRPSAGRPGIAARGLRRAPSSSPRARRQTGGAMAPVAAIRAMTMFVSHMAKIVLFSGPPKQKFATHGATISPMSLPSGVNTCTPVADEL